MNREYYNSVFLDEILRLNEYIELNGKLNILSSHVHAENFYRDLLNVIFDFSLHNLNEEEPNATAIDLIDRDKKIILQVTSSCSRRKIESTLAKEAISNYANEKYKIKFVFIGKQNERIKGKEYKNPNNIQFDSEKDIILTSDLHSTFTNLSIEKQKQVIELLHNELSPVVQRKPTFIVTNEFIDRQLKSSINSLGPRYTPELNVKTHNLHAFEAITCSESFSEKVQSFLMKIVDTIQRMEDSNLENAKQNEENSKFVKRVKDKVEKIELFLKMESYLEEKLAQFNELDNLITFIYSEADAEMVSLRKLENGGQTIRYRFLSEINRNIYNYHQYLKSCCYETLYNPYLLLYGEAGIGKSHLLADMAEDKRKQGHIVFMFLGQHFSSNLDPWTQIMNGLDIEASTEEFLSSINSQAKISHKRAILIIDALNEGEGNLLWKNYMQKFFDQIKDYSHISLIFSIRTPFIESVLPDAFIHQNNVSIYEHVGFAAEDYSPIQSFCSYYDLEEPVFPVLEQEYHNPLFLKLVCELFKGRNQTTFNQEVKMSQLFSFIIEDTNKRILDSGKLQYDANINVIYEVLQEFIAYQHKSETRYIPYREAYKEIREAAVDYTTHPTKVLETLIQENILTETINFEDTKIVYFVYERMGDYLLASYLLTKYRKQSLPKEDYIKSIKDDDDINKYFNIESNFGFNSGLLQALAVLLPEQLGIELFEVYTGEKNNNDLMDVMLDSFIWRSSESFTTQSKEYIKDYLSRYHHTIKQLFDVCIKKTGILNHPLNSQGLSKILFQIPLAIRDSIWSTKISTRNYDVSNIINWSWENSEKIKPEVVELYETALIWMLSSTNIRIRNKATKALANLFKQHLKTIIPMLQKFKDVDDPYILERLYAAAFGAVVRSEIQEVHVEIAKYIHQTIFDQSEVYPHILLRDYARQLIEYVRCSYELPWLDVVTIRPPYKSEWYSYTPTNKEIDALELEKTQDVQAYKAYGVRRIISSMITEYGRGIGSYGDFGRYVFGPAVREWDNQFESDQELSNIAIQRIFDMGYDAELHGDFDSSRGSYNIQREFIERIGKKYQWIALHEVMAKLTDHFPTYKEEKVYTTEYEEYLKRNIGNISKMLLGESENEIDELNEEEHIIEIKKIATAPYAGPWEPFLRDIDPTFLKKEFPEKNSELLPNQLPTEPSAEWAQSTSSKEDIRKYLEIEYENKPFISLYSLFEWELRNQHTRFKDRDAKFFNASALFVRNEDKSTMLKEGMESWDEGVPTPYNYSGFAYEYYWSESYKAYEEERMVAERSKEILASHQYLWEADRSIENMNSFKYMIPSQVIVDYFELTQKDEGVWKNPDGKILCFDSSLFGYERCLLIEKEALMTFLEDQDYSLMWKAYTEKVSNNYMNRCWYTVHYEEGSFEKYHVKEDIFKNDSRL